MPLPFPPLARPRRALLLLATSTLLVMVALTWSGAVLRTDVAPRGIVSFELAYTPQAASAILESWDATARVAAAFNLGLDYLFLVLYASALALAATLTTRLLEARWWALGAAIAWGQVLAAVLDAIENAALLVILNQDATSPWPEVAALCAVIKFALVGVGLLFAGFGLWLHRRRP